MARPLKDGLNYYQHDVNMSADEKLEALEAVHGNDGYAVYNKLLERIYKSFGKLTLADDVQRLSIAKKCNVTAEKFGLIIADAVRFGLFDREPWETENRLTSDRIRAQLKTVEDEREKWRKKSEGENPGTDGLSPEKTPVTTGENPGSPSVKVHKAEQSRAEEDIRAASSGAELVDNSPKTPEEEARLVAFCLARAKASKADRPSAYAKRIMREPDVQADWREQERKEAASRYLRYPEPPACSCGGRIQADRHEGTARCVECGDWYIWDEGFVVWAKSQEPGFEDAG